MTAIPLSRHEQTATDAPGQTPQEAPGTAPQPPQDPPLKPVPPPVPASHMRKRHWGILLSFLIMVLAPTGVASWYLWERAADQYASNVGFTVRKEEAASAVASVLGTLNLSGSRTSDSDVLYEFIQSQELVATIDKKLNLRAIWSKDNPGVDPIFAYHPPGTIEDLLRYWGRMVRISYDSGTGLINIRVLAFDPKDARAIAREIYAESTRMINKLSAVAREDAIRYARDELSRSVERLKVARAALTAFRNRTQIVDPTADVNGQMGLLSTLQQQLAEALIEMDMLRKTTRSNDPRIAQAELKIQVIENRIKGERLKLGIGNGGSSSSGGAYATLVGKYESLVVDRQFAEQSNTAALATYDGALADARRQSRYLAAYMRPTLAQQSEYPKRPMLLGLIGLFLFLTWAISVLVYYSLKDRR